MPLYHHGCIPGPGRLVCALWVHRPGRCSREWSPTDVSGHKNNPYGTQRPALAGSLLSIHVDSEPFPLPPPPPPSPPLRAPCTRRHPGLFSGGVRNDCFHPLREVRTWITGLDESSSSPRLPEASPLARAISLPVPCLAEISHPRPRMDLPLPKKQLLR